MTVRKRVSISAAKAIADEFDKDQVIVLSWSKADNKTWVTTYGRTQAYCEQAAEGGNRVKRALGWPEQLCQDMTARQKARKQEVADLKMQVARYVAIDLPADLAGIEARITGRATVTPISDLLDLRALLEVAKNLKSAQSGN